MDEQIKPLNIDIKRTVSNGKVYEMVDLETYGKSPKSYLGRDDVGIEIRDKNGKTLVLPLREKYSGNPISPGVYNAGAIDFILMPDQASYNKYIPEQTISLSNTMDAKRMIEAGNALEKLDEPFITTPDNITKIPVTSMDEPEMKCLKTAINEKHVDLDKYSGRFGSNYPNDKRQLKNNQVTLNIIKRFCNNMDMEAVLTIRDKRPDVPNPLKKDISVSLTDGYMDMEEN